ncbi:MAG: 2-C-methyl-D-erythritol 2,4-cyclodiphosphate synthase [Actinomycetota bacterium]|nr:2-C-methyl-D-erythritol 2,4-cyclodiphosphate synthase [Actinomycetota bacterium]
MRVGIGYDVHAFDEGRALVLGGVTIDGSPGLAGWSDADVVAHAVIDALLGAAALGDIGEHFSEDSVPEGSSSVELLAKAASMVTQAGFRIVNVDVVVMVQDVRIAPHRGEMVDRMAEALGISPGSVGLKATTTDRLGFVGKGEGAAAMAVASVEAIGR